VITRDQRIRYRPIEKRLWVEHGVRGFILTGRDSQSTVGSLAVLEQHWSRIEQVIINEPTGPWMYALTTAGLRPIPI
jgi:hypothetical protein